MAEASKERAWLEQGLFFEGTLPSPRTQHGLTSSAQNMYSFGGANNQGGMYNFVEIPNFQQLTVEFFHASLRFRDCCERSPRCSICE
jgi:hypothetical protein